MSIVSLVEMEIERCFLTRSHFASTLWWALFQHHQTWPNTFFFFGKKIKQKKFIALKT